MYLNVSGAINLKLINLKLMDAFVYFDGIWKNENTLIILQSRAIKSITYTKPGKHYNTLFMYALAPQYILQG